VVRRKNILSQRKVYICVITGEESNEHSSSRPGGAGGPREASNQSEKESIRGDFFRPLWSETPSDKAAASVTLHL